MAVKIAESAEPTRQQDIPDRARRIVRELASNELVFGVVGPVGSGTSEIAKSLERFLKDKGYAAAIIKARDVIAEWATKTGFVIDKEDEIKEVVSLQNAGDAMRESDVGAVAIGAIKAIRQVRAKQTGKTFADGEAVDPDGNPRAFIIDSLRNPAEVELLRGVYQEAFCVIGVVCDEEARKGRLRVKYKTAGEQQIDKLMERDEKADISHGQQVSDTFHLADFFLDNSAPRVLVGVDGSKKSNPEWIVVDEIGRLVDILTHARIVRPRPNEVAMFHAFGARMQSACLSRQVGAALMDMNGDIMGTGTNEVPIAGGGVYGAAFDARTDLDFPSTFDHRCTVHGGYCRNTREQNAIIKDLFELEDLRPIELTDALIKKVRRTRIGQLIEFSRAVHAEMEALLSAARQGKSTRGTRLFVTTFPCHQCARHIVAAGVDEVQFIEPYLKSKAIPLHGDAITTSPVGWISPTLLRMQKKDQSRKDVDDKKPQVLFRPFVGVAPRLYRRAFYKDRDLKDNFEGSMLKQFGPPNGFGANEALRVSYAAAEAMITNIKDGK